MADATEARVRGDRSPTDGAPSTHWPELDLLKAVAILAVVLIHVKRSWLEGRPSSLELALDPLLRFAVPAFLFASGALGAAHAERAGFLASRLRRLLPPYALATVAAWAFLAARGEAPTLRDAALDLVTASALGPYYYVFVLATLLAAAPLLRRLGRGGVLALLAPLLVAQWWSETLALGLSFFWHLRNPLLWAAYFVAGWGYASLREPLRRGLAGRPAAALAALPWALLAGWMVAAGVITDPGPTRVWLLIWAALGLLLALGLGLGLDRKVGWARPLSDASYTIYLWHPFAVYPIRDALLPGPEVLSWSFLLLPWLAGVVLPLGLLVVVRRVAGRAAARTWIGG
jgi:peptidoglycan/LPS O-acetylase OafA/YrhL